MKKVILTLTTALAACLLFISCGTTQKINPEANTKLAILSIYGNAALPWYELDKNGNEPSPSQGLLGKALTSMFDMENPEMLTAEDRLNYAEDYLKKAFYENFNIEAADKEAVTGSRKYKMLSEGLFSSMNTAKKADGYKLIEKLGAPTISKIYKETGANTAIILKFAFFKKLTSGTKSHGTAVPYVTMRATVYDEKGKEFHYKTYKAEGSPAKISRKDSGSDELIAAYPETIEKLINQLCVDLM